MTEWETTQDRVEMIHKAAKEQNYLDGFEYGEKVGHAQYLDRKERTETRLYNAGGLPVSLILPHGEHKDIPEIGYFWTINGECRYAPINPIYGGRFE
jgi:hypothetical protein